MSDFEIKVSRKGQELGSFSREEVIKRFRSRAFLPSDHYWHAGMAAWGVLSDFIKSEELREKEQQRLAAEKAELLRKQELEAKEAERLKVKAEKVAKKRANFFVCQCCRHEFAKPDNPGDSVIGGYLLTLFGALVCFFPVFGPILGGLMVLWGMVLILAGGLRSPYCPKCRSTSYYRPSPDEESLFD